MFMAKNYLKEYGKGGVIKESDDGGKIYASQYAASQAYDKEKVYQVRLRVPKDWEQTIKDKAENSGKSVNQFICDLIEKEIK